MALASGGVEVFLGLGKGKNDIVFVRFFDSSFSFLWFFLKFFVGFLVVV